MAEVLRLTDTVRAAATARRTTLSPDRRAKEDDLATRFGISASRLETSWTRFGTVRLLWSYAMRLPVDTTATAPEDRARAFIDAHAVLFGLTTSGELSVDGVRDDEGGKAVDFTQTMDGLPVFNASMNIEIAADGAVRGVGGVLLPDGVVGAPDPALDAAAAAASLGGDAAGAQLGWYDPEMFGSPGSDVHLAWRVAVPSKSVWVYADATTGAVLNASSWKKYNDPHRETFYCNGCNKSQLPGTLEYNDRCDDLAGTPDYCTGTCNGGHCDVAPPWLGTSQQVDQSAENSVAYWWDNFGWDGWDGQPTSTYHRLRVASDADPATGSDGEVIWLGTYGGIPENEKATIAVGSGATCVEAIQHEVTHGVIEAKAGNANLGLCHVAQMLDEGIPDIFAEYTSDWLYGPPDWIHDTGCSSSSRKSHLRDPGCYSFGVDTPYGTCSGNPLAPSAPQPDHWANYRYVGEGHFNSTIISQAGELMGREPAEGAETHWGVSVTGIGRSEAEQVWNWALPAWRASTTMSDWYYYMIWGCIVEAGADELACINAVLSVGPWSPDTTTPLASEYPVGLAQWTVNGQKRWYAFYERAPGSYYQCYRYKTCDYDQGCGWSAETCYEQGTPHGPAVAVLPGVGMFSCMDNIYGSIWCLYWDSTGTEYGASPGGSNIYEQPSLVYYYGQLWLTYRDNTSHEVYWRYLSTYPYVHWSSAMDAGFKSKFTPPVLASSSEDVWNPSNNYMFLVYTYDDGASDGIAYKQFDTPTFTWTGGGVVQESDSPLPDILTYDRPAVAMFRGRLQLAVHGIASWPYADADKTIWYASCKAPCDQNAPPAACDKPEDSEQWSRFVPQQGLSQTGITLNSQAAGDGYLYMFHRLNTIGDNTIAYRASYAQ